MPPARESSLIWHTCSAYPDGHAIPNEGGTSAYCWVGEAFVEVAR